MRNALALVATLALAGCIPGGDTTAAKAVRDSAIKLRRDVGEVTDKVNSAAYAVVFVCNVRGDETTECKALEGAHDVASKATAAANKLIDLYDVTGAGLEAIESAIALARTTAGELKDKAEKAEGAIRAALRSLDSAGQAVGLVDRPAGEEGPAAAAPASEQPEDAGAGAP